MSNSSFEFVTFRLGEGVSSEAYQGVFTKVYEKFLKNHPEIRQFFHLYEPTTQEYANFVEWSSLEAALEAEKKIFATPEGQAWFGSMQQSSIQMNHFHSLVKEVGNPEEKIQGIEISYFRLAPRASDENLVVAARNIVDGLYRGKSGFYAHEVLVSKDFHYLDVLYANSRERANELCSSWFASDGRLLPTSQSYMDSIQEDSVKLRFFQVIL